MNTPLSHNKILPIFSQGGKMLNDIGYQIHFHPCCEILYIAQGKCSVSTSDTVFELNQDDLLILAPHTDHSQENHGFCKSLFVTFHIPEQEFSQKTRILRAPDTLVIPRIMQLISDNCDNKIYYVNDGLIYSLLCRITMIEETLNHTFDVPPPLEKALKAIDRDFANPNLMAALPSISCVSAGYLRYLFQKHLNMSPQKKLLDRRMVEARRLLRNHNLLISEIAQQCGYPNANYFARIFQKLTLCSPSKFREIEWNRLDAEIRK